MKKLLIIVTIIFSTLSSFSQTMECEKDIKEFVSNIQGRKTKDLIPYSIYNEGEYQWGYMDKTTKKKLTKPILEYPYMFNPDIKFFYKDCEITINKDLTYKMEELMLFHYNVSQSIEQSIIVKDTTNNYIGFEVDAMGNLTAYSKKYYKNEYYHGFNISKPFLYNNEYYAIVKNDKNQSVIINRKGEEQKDFIFSNIIDTEHNYKGEKLLYVEDSTGNKGLVTMAGDKILYGELLNYPYNSNYLFGYSLQHDGLKNGHLYFDSISKSGILDLTTMQWLIKPQKEMKIIDIYFTSDNDIECEVQNRNLVDIYFIVEERNMRYLIDIKGNKYKAQ